MHISVISIIKLLVDSRGKAPVGGLTYLLDAEGLVFSEMGGSCCARCMLLEAAHINAGKTKVSCHPLGQCSCSHRPMWRHKTEEQVLAVTSHLGDLNKRKVGLFVCLFVCLFLSLCQGGLKPHLIKVITKSNDWAHGRVFKLGYLNISTNNTDIRH